MEFVKPVAKFFLKSLCGILYPLDERLILFAFESEYSGCNAIPILERLNDSELKSYRVEILRLESTPLKGPWKRIACAWKRYKLSAKSKLIVTTHGFEKVRRKTIHVELWHGFATKKGGLIARRVKRPTSKPDVFCCYSGLDAVLKCARSGLTIDRFVVTGAPRNDYLFTEDGHRNLERIFQLDLESSKKILFAPTFRWLGHDPVSGKRSFENIFDFEKFDVKEFQAFLEENRIFLFVKLHPAEEKRFKEKVKTFETERIKLIDVETLKREKLDFYKLLNGFDLLITDYSSIYFDWLLLNRPVIFVPVDMKDYWERRGGWLLEPYDFWAAGPKCTDQESLQREILKCLEDPSYYEDRRETVRDVVHHYKDAHSTERVIRLLEEIMRREKI